MLRHPANEEDKAKNYEPIRSVLAEMAQNPEHPRQWDAIRALWSPSNEEDKAKNYESIRSVLAEMAQNPEHPRQWDAIHMLRHPANEEEQAQNHELIRPALIEIVRNPAHPKQWGVIRALWYCASKEGEAKNYEPIRSALIEIALNARTQNQREAIRCLRDSEDPKDQALGLFLEIGYFQTPKNVALPMQPIDLSGESPEMLLELFNELIVTGRIPSHLLPYIQPSFEKMLGLGEEGMGVAQALAWVEDEFPPEMGTNGRITNHPLVILMTRAVVLEGTKLWQRVEAARFGIGMTHENLLGNPVVLAPEDAARAPAGALDPTRDSPLLIWGAQ